jgi:hypothetical protein
MVNVPLRLLSVLRATVNLTLPLPVPLEPAVIVIHDSLDRAVQMQVLPVDTLIVLAPPSALTSTSLGEIEYEQEGGGGEGGCGEGDGGGCGEGDGGGCGEGDGGGCGEGDGGGCGEGDGGGCGEGDGGEGGCGEGDGAGDVPAACVTVNRRPAIVRVPARAAAEFALTLNPTGPSPAPDAPDVTVIHAALLTAVHRHPPCVDTAAVPVPPDAATL